MRIGLAGVGRIGAFHADTLSRLPGVDSVIVADADGGRARQVADRLHVDAAESPDVLLESGIDALVIATATNAHPEYIVRGVRAGLPVFCEKPVAPDIERTIEVIKQTSDADAPLQIGFQRRFDPGYNAARCDVRLEVLGAKDSVSVGLDDRLPLRSVEPGATFPSGEPYPLFLERFGRAYRAELAAFVELAANGGQSPCTVLDALEAFYIAEACELSRVRHAPVRLTDVRLADARLTEVRR